MRDFVRAIVPSSGDGDGGSAVGGDDGDVVVTTADEDCASAAAAGESAPPLAARDRVPLFRFFFFLPPLPPPPPPPPTPPTVSASTPDALASEVTRGRTESTAIAVGIAGGGGSCSGVPGAVAVACDDESTKGEGNGVTGGMTCDAPSREKSRART